MADFQPAPYREYVYDNTGSSYRLVGWYSEAGTWLPESMEPVIAQPDGDAGIGRWRTFHGEDPWFYPTT